MIRPLLITAGLACLAACAAVPPPADPFPRAPRSTSPSADPAPALRTAEPAPSELERSVRGPSDPADSADPSFTLLDSELQTQGGWAVSTSSTPVKRSRPVWKPGQALMQGFFGAQIMDQVELSGGASPTIENSGNTYLPVIGGGGQWKLAGDKVDFGIEGMFSFAWQSNATAVAVGGGGAAVAVDFGLFLVDLYGGPFVSMFLGDKTRVYLAAGPLLEWANYDPSTAAGGFSATGFGGGGYARTGIEFVLPSNTMIGLGARWSKTSISMSNNLGNLDLQGVQAVLTVTRGF